jgi:hypothetical protein
VIGARVPAGAARALLVLAGAALGAAAIALGPGQAATARPMVWVQAGHVAPREPGYRWQTGAPGGPFGSEREFNRRLAERLAARLRGAGVAARTTPGRITPWAARGAVFVAVHHDGPGGVAGVAYAIAGTPEYYYRGEGAGEPRPRPYPDSAPHRRATSISPGVERRSRALAATLSASLARVFTPAGGARSGWDGVVPVDRHKRMSRYYGFRRTRADARVIVELGAVGADDAFLRRVDVIAGALERGIVDHLRARGLPVPR